MNSSVKATSYTVNGRHFASAPRTARADSRILPTLAAGLAALATSAPCLAARRLPMFPVSVAAPASRMSHACRRGLPVLAASLAGLVGTVQAQAPDDTIAARLAETRARLEAINTRSTRVRDINEIEILQRSYGYYVDKMLWEHVLDLFTEDATMEIGPSGVYVGKDSIRNYLYSLSDGQEGPLEGVLFNHLQLQPVLTLSDDGLSAQGRWRALILTGTHGAGSGGNWGEGPYENEYIKEDGVWKISKLHWFATFVAPYEGGWLNVDAADVRAHSMGRGVEPDEPPSVDYEPWPAVFVPPFHYPNPVTGN